MNHYDYPLGAFNYTQITELYGYTYNLSPRWHMWQTTYDYSTPSSDGATMLPSGRSWINFIDLEREKELEIGTDWPYPDLKLG